MTTKEIMHELSQYFTEVKGFSLKTAPYYHRGGDVDHEFHTWAMVIEKNNVLTELTVEYVKTLGYGATHVNTLHVTQRKNERRVASKKVFLDKWDMSTNGILGVLKDQYNMK